MLPKSSAPTAFTVVWSFFKLFLAKETQEKVNILGKDYLDTLTKFIPKDSIPEMYGGSGRPRTGFRPAAGGPLPEKYYRTTLEGEGVIKLEVPRRSHQLVTIEVGEGSILEWEFLSDGYDIGFGTYYQASPEATEPTTELAAIERVDSHQCM